MHLSSLKGVPISHDSFSAPVGSGGPIIARGVQRCALWDSAGCRDAFPASGCLQAHRETDVHGETRKRPRGQTRLETWRYGLCQSRGCSRTRDGVLRCPGSGGPRNAHGRGGVMKHMKRHIWALLFCHTSSGRKART